MSQSVEYQRENFESTNLDYFNKSMSESNMFSRVERVLDTFGHEHLALLVSLKNTSVFSAVFIHNNFPDRMPHVLNVRLRDTNGQDLETKGNAHNRNILIDKGIPVIDIPGMVDLTEFDKMNPYWREDRYSETFSKATERIRKVKVAVSKEGLLYFLPQIDCVITGRSEEDRQGIEFMTFDYVYRSNPYSDYPKVNRLFYLHACGIEPSSDHDDLAAYGQFCGINPDDLERNRT